MKIMTGAIISKASYVLVGGLVAAVGWGVVNLGNIIEQMEKQKPGKNPVAVHAKAPQLKPKKEKKLTFKSTSRFRNTSKAAVASNRQDNTTATPTLPMGITSTVFHHSATISTPSAGSRIISRNNGGGSASMGIRSTAEDAKHASSLSMGGSMLALSSATMITRPGAVNAAAIATTSVNAPIIKPRKANGLPDYNEDPVPDEVEVPLGDVLFPLMFLALVYAIYRRKKVRGLEIIG